MSTNSSMQSNNQPSSPRDELTKLLGHVNVRWEDEECKRLSRATFDVTSRVTGVLYVETVKQLAEVFKIANIFSLVVYPISGGRNWGLGSTVPPDREAIVIDLSKMNRIQAFNEELGYITVEPGVTFRDVAEYLEKNNSSLFLSMIGGPADASLIGNAVERGDGVGPLGDKAFHIAGFQVVLPNGEVLESGFGAFGNHTINHLTPHAPGPDVHGLFLQSNFGIVTRMTFWLRPKPAIFHGVTFTINRSKEISRAISALRTLQAQGIIESNSFALWNVWKVLASQMQYPWKSTGDRFLPDHELRKHLPKFWRSKEWCGYIACYSASPAMAKTTEKEIMKALKGNVSSILPLNKKTNALMKIFSLPIQYLTGFNMEKLFNAFYRKPVALGIPIDLNVGSLYWRKKTSPTMPMDPHKDGCGLHWLCHVAPFRSQDIESIRDAISRTAQKYGFEPNIAFLNTSERSMRLFSVLTFDRSVPGEDARAQQCIEESHAELIRLGYPPFRLGIQLLSSVAIVNKPYQDLLASIKKSVDPHGVLTPARYSFEFSHEMCTLHSIGS